MLHLILGFVRIPKSKLSSSQSELFIKHFFFEFQIALAKRLRANLRLRIAVESVLVSPASTMNCLKDALPMISCLFLRISWRREYLMAQYRNRSQSVTSAAKFSFPRSELASLMTKLRRLDYQCLRRARRSSCLSCGRENSHIPCVQF